MRLRMTLTVLDRGPAPPSVREIEVEAAEGSTAADLLDALADVGGEHHLSAGGEPVASTVLVGRPPLVDGVSLTLAAGPARGARHRAVPPRTPVRLAVTHGPDAGRLVEVPVGCHTLGRSPEADVRVEDSLLSRVHAEVVVGPDGVCVRDLASTNGTRVGGECAGDQPRALVSGAEIVLGDTTLTLRTATGGAGCDGRATRRHPHGQPPSAREGRRGAAQLHPARASCTTPPQPAPLARHGSPHPCGGGDGGLLRPDDAGVRPHGAAPPCGDAPQ